MSNGKQKLELSWIGKEKRPQLEPRILRADSELSHHASARRLSADHFDNVLVQGDNLLALKALEAEYAGRVKCICIDPPYNTGSAFEHYDDGLEHSTWLTLMRDRLIQLHPLLADEGSIWITIDDNESHYLKVLLDEVFGRRNFITNIVWQKKFAGKADSRHFSDFHDHILVYAKDVDALDLNGMPRTAEQDSRYKNLDDDPRGVWASDNLLRTEYREYAFFPIKTPSGKEYLPPKGSSWRFTKERIAELHADNRIWYGENGGNMPRLKRFLHEVAQALPPLTWWAHSEVGHNSEAKKELGAVLPDVPDLFPTPKPERLIRRILELATDEGDWVLDSFAGSGTTGAVAHKLGRRWIMVEQGEHARTHIVPRLRKVIDGEDPGGVTAAVGWKGGGGFRFYHLAPSLLQKDQFDNWVISKKYDAPMLAEAMCKHMGFTYAPSTQHYWMHGYSSERDFIYVTTQSLPHDQLRALSDAVGPDRSLLVCCKAFQGKHVAEFRNLTVKKIPLAILHRCEWGKDDYSAGVAALAAPEPPPQVVEANGEDAEPEEPPRPRRKRKKKADAPETPMLDFDGEEA